MCRAVCGIDVRICNGISTNKIFKFVIQSLQISRKERVSPWEILEGHKNPAPLNLSWFGAVKLEKKQLKYEEQNK